MKFLKQLKYSKIIRNFKYKFEKLNSEYVNINEIYEIILPEKEIIFKYFGEYLARLPFFISKYLCLYFARMEIVWRFYYQYILLIYEYFRLVFMVKKE